MNKCFIPNYIYYILIVIKIILNMFIINSLYKIDKNKDCKCGNNSRNVYLKEWLIFMIIFDIYLIMFFILSNNFCYDHYITDIYNTDVLKFYMSILTIISLIMFIRLFLYIRWLRNECKCSYGIEEKIIYWILIIKMVIYVLYIIFFIIIMVSLINIFINNRHILLHHN